MDVWFRVLAKLITRKLSLAGHCYRHSELPVNGVIIWKPEHGRRDPGRVAKTMIKMMIEYAGMDIKEELAYERKLQPLLLLIIYER